MRATDSLPGPSSRDGVQTRSYTRYGRALSFIGLAFLVLFMLSSGVRQWGEVVEIQIARIQGVDEAGPKEDYITFYAAGKLVLDGRGDELYDVESIAAVEHEAMGRPVGGSGVLAFFNPPFVAALFAPLALLTPQAFSTVMLGLVIVTVLAGGLLLLAFLRLSTARETSAFWLIFLTLYATVWVVVEQQLSMFLLIGWLGFAYAQHAGRHRASGLALALVLVKPQMALLPVGLLAWNRDWEALKSFLAVAVGLVVASILISGPGVLVEYPRYLLDTTAWESQGVSTHNMLGLNGLVARLIGDRSPSPLLVVPLLLLTLAVVMWVWKGGWQPASPRFFLQIGITLTAALLINPHLYLQDMVLLALVLSLCIAYSRSASRHLEVWLPVVILEWFVLLYGPRLQVDHGIPVVAPATICLMAVLFAILRRSHTQVADSTADFAIPAAA